MSLLSSEFCPFFPLSNTGIDLLFDDGGANLAGGLDFLAIIVEAVGYDCFCTVGVVNNLLGRENGWIVKFLVVGPVCSSALC